MIIHDLAWAVRYADEIAVLDKKKIAFSQEAENCLESGIFEEVFNVKARSFSENGESFTVFE